MQVKFYWQFGFFSSLQKWAKNRAMQTKNNINNLSSNTAEQSDLFLKTWLNILIYFSFFEPIFRPANAIQFIHAQL